MLQLEIDVIVIASPPTGRWPGKVDCANQCFINFGVLAKFFVVVIVQNLDPSFKWLRALIIVSPIRSANLFEHFAITLYPLLR